MRSLIVVGALVALLASCAEKPTVAPEPVPAADTQRETTGGTVIGTHADNGVFLWRAIPYAAAPVGDLRWRAPRPVNRWDGVRQAVKSGPRCPQITNVLNAPEGVASGTLVGSEDCLTLDIYSPPAADTAAGTAGPLPVMVWIHGGSNVWGGSDQYDASNLAKNENVVVIAVQYRLNILGNFSDPALRAAATTPDDKAASFGILDLAAALAWVRDNAAAFGGDPGKVTIFGESAGGQNVAALLAAPQARGLFHRAIIESGFFDSTTRADAEGGAVASAHLENTTHDVEGRLAVTTAEALRAVPLEKLFKALTLNGQGYLNMPTLIDDGVATPAAGLRAALETPGSFADVPIITGTNRDEMKLFEFADPRFVKKTLGVLIAPRDPDFYAANAEYLSRIWRLRSVDQAGALLAAAGNSSVYGYRFDWDDGGVFLTADTGALIGACHAMEIPFVFDRFRLFGKLDPVIFSKKTEAERRELSRRMEAYWGAFARTGAPGTSEDGLAWPKWSEGGGSLMIFDTASGGGARVVRHVETEAQIVADIAADKRLDGDKRCRLAVGAAEFRNPVTEGLAAKLGCS